MNVAIVLAFYFPSRPRNTVEEGLLEPDPVAVPTGRLDQIGRRAPGCSREAARGGDQRGHVGEGDHW